MKNSRNWQLILCSLLFTFVFTSCGKTLTRYSVYPSEVIKNYEIGIAPSLFTVPPDSLFTQSETWQEVLAGVNFYKFYSMQVINEGSVWRTRITPDLFTDFVKANGIEIGIETGSFHFESPNAELLTELQFKSIIAAGGKIATVHLDGPVRRLLRGINNHPKALSLSAAADRLALFWQNIHRKYPGIKIGIITNLPNWDYSDELPGYIGRFTDSTGHTYQEVLDVLYEKITAAGEKIAFVEVDCPYNYFRQKETLRKDGKIDNGEKLRSLSAWCWQRDIQFHVIINSEVNNASAKTYYEDVMQYLLALRRENVFPDKFLFQSWYKYPRENLPENKKYTFMNTVRDGIILLQALYPTPH